MCCPNNLHSNNIWRPNLNIATKYAIKGYQLSPIDIDANYHLTGYLDSTPITLAASALRFFQRLDLLEKLAGLYHTTFHLIGPYLKRYVPTKTYTIANNLHHSAHQIHTLF